MPPQTRHIYHFYTRLIRYTYGHAWHCHETIIGSSKENRLPKIFRLTDPTTKIAVWSVPGSSIPEFVEKLGYHYVTHHTTAPDVRETDLLISDGFHVIADELKNVVEQLSEGKQLLMLHHPIKLGKRPIDSMSIDPFEFGKARFYPINRWVDVIYGSENLNFIKARPVVRVRRL